MFILYDLYFDGIDGIDDDEHDLSTLMLFPQEHSQYLTFSFDGSGLDGLGNKGQYPFRSIDFRCIYILLLDPCLNARN